VAVLVILALAGSLLEPAETLAGFSSEPALVVVVIFVLGGALHQTGLRMRPAGGSDGSPVTVNLAREKRLPTS
jgi:hypothetical protein